MPGSNLKWKTRTILLLLLSAAISATAQHEMTEISPDVPARDSAENPAAGTVPFLLTKGVPVVQVFLNGHGPYSFLVDTGTNVTLVEQPVLDQLSISAQTMVPLHSATVDSSTPEAILETIALAGLNLHKMEVSVLKRGQLAIYGDHVLGVLGEDFLKHFDLLLDYRHGVLTLDMSSTLAASLTGEHIAFLRSGQSPGGLVPDRILVQSKLPAFNSDAMACLVDSGTHLAVIFLRESSMSRMQETGSSMNLSSPIGGSSNCRVEPSRVEVGNERVRSTDVVACTGKKQADADFDCLLPTNLFRSVFISHLGGYVVLNPQVVEQQARVTPGTTP